MLVSEVVCLTNVHGATLANCTSLRKGLGTTLVCEAPNEVVASLTPASPEGAVPNREAPAHPRGGITEAVTPRM